MKYDNPLDEFDDDVRQAEENLYDAEAAREEYRREHMAEDMIDAAVARIEAQRDHEADAIDAHMLRDDPATFILRGLGR